jgi:hypothetical protein
VIEGIRYRGMPAPPAVFVVPVEVEPGARVVELRFVLEPHAADAETEIIVMARTVRIARVFFMAGSGVIVGSFCLLRWLSFVQAKCQL